MQSGQLLLYKPSNAAYRWFSLYDTSMGARHRSAAASMNERKRAPSRFSHLLRAFLLVCLVGGPLDGQTRPPVDSAATLRGRLLGVYDDESGEPIAGAVVTDAVTGDHALTTRTGTVSLSFVKAKGSIVQVRKLGYEPWSEVVDPTEPTPITITLKRVTTLAPVVTTATHDMVKDAGTRDGIGVRCENPHVTCTRETELTQSPSRLPGDFVVKASGIVGPGMMHSTTGGICKASYFVDGTAWNRNGPPIDYSNSKKTDQPGVYATSDIAAIEVYETGVARPLRFSGDPKCGAIVIWTK